MAAALPDVSSLLDRVKHLEQRNERLEQRNERLEQKNERLEGENAFYREQNERMQVIYEEAVEDNRRLEDRAGALEIQVQLLRGIVAQQEVAARARDERDAQRDEADRARDARDAQRDAQIALLMARVHPMPQPPVLLVPRHEPVPPVLADPPVQEFDPDEPDPIDFDDFPSPPRSNRLPPPPPVDNARVLTTVQQWCNSVDQYVKDQGLMPLPALKKPQGIVIDQEEVAYQAIARVERTLQEFVAFQDRVSQYRSQYREPPEIALVRRNILSLVPLSARLCNHLSVMIAAIKVSGWSFTQAGPDVQNNRNAALIALCGSPGVFAEMNRALRDDIDLARLAILRRISENDLFEISQFGISFNPQKGSASGWNRPASLANASDRLKNLESFVMEVVQESPLEIRHAGDRCKNNESIGMVVVRKSGYGLRFMPGLQNNLTVVATAAATAGEDARKNGDDRGPEYASPQIRAQADAAFNRAKNGGGCAVM